MHLAAYMGAKNIILIGHDCGTLNGEPNFKDYHTDKTYKIVWKNGKKIILIGYQKLKIKQLK
jgi:hypothetical protein